MLNMTFCIFFYDFYFFSDELSMSTFVYRRSLKRSELDGLNLRYFCSYKLCMPCCTLLFSTGPLVIPFRLRYES